MDALLRPRAGCHALGSRHEIIIGQLDREQFYRKFVGQIDELAVYSRPLSEEEVVRHYKLIRPSWQPPTPQQQLEETATAQATDQADSI